MILAPGEGCDSIFGASSIDSEVDFVPRVETFNTLVNGNAGLNWVNFHVSFAPEAEIDPFTFKMLFLRERIDGEWWSRGEMYGLGEFDIPE